MNIELGLIRSLICRHVAKNLFFSVEAFSFVLLLLKIVSSLISTIEFELMILLHLCIPLVLFSLLYVNYFFCAYCVFSF